MQVTNLPSTRKSLTLEASLRSIFVVLSVAAIAYTPVASEFVTASKGCEVIPPAGVIVRTLANYKHIISFCILFILASQCFRHGAIWKSAVVVLLLSAVVEAEQAFFLEGHCRVRDLLPNLIAVGFGALIVSSVRFATGRRRAKIGKDRLPSS